MTTSEEAPLEVVDNILSLSGSDFFDELEKRINTKIPVQLRYILQLNDIDCVAVLAEVNNEYVETIETFVKREMNANMISPPQTLEEYLGKFKNNQQNFVFSVGQKILLNLMIKICKNYVHAIETLQPVQNASGVRIERNSEALESEGDECIQQPVGKVDKMIGLAKYIGSLMITAYNDAKRSTLSAWSWPSRRVAADMASHYNINGKVEGYTPNFQYVTPSQHPQFLNCIVKSDLHRFVSLLKDALAVSLRVDGSVDRTQNHNIYVVGNVVHKSTSMSTVFLGFKIPEDGKSLAYFEVVKEVVGDLLPWEEFLSLISSIVTDGEGLNSGSENGLWIRIQRSNTTDKPILSIWCIDHRFNLGWKDLCRDISLVLNLIDEASSLSTYFHNSGDRTQKLREVALANKIPQPLRYPAYFSIRWTEFVFALFNATLRNWRVSMQYFLNENESGLSQRWLLYDRIHLLTFMTDVLCLLKTFHKTFQSDSISILHVQKKREKLVERLQKCIDETLPDGWEQMFLSKIETKVDGVYFFGHKLVRNTNRKSRPASCTFTIVERTLIITTLIQHMNTRLDFDIHLQRTLEPLGSMKTSFCYQKLQLCYEMIVPDLNENMFHTDYASAFNLLKEYDIEGPLEILQKLELLAPGKFNVLKIALAAAKPHSSDVERLINMHNKIKDTDRESSSPKTLFNHLYINVNMNPLIDFDPTDAVTYWMDEKKRNPTTPSKSKEQEWFKGVFSEAKQREERQHKNIIKF